MHYETSHQNPYYLNHLILRRQYFRLLGAAFRLFAPDGSVAFYCVQKAFRLKQDIRVYTDSNKQHQLLSINARQIIDISATYDVTDAQTGTYIGALRRDGIQSIFVRDAWTILDSSDNPVAQIQEDTMQLGLIRRYVLGLIPQKYSILVDGRQAAHFAQRFNPFLFYMDLRYDPQMSGLLDRRLGIAAAVLLAVIEDRQR